MELITSSHGINNKIFLSTKKYTSAGGLDGSGETRPLWKSSYITTPTHLDMDTQRSLVYIVRKKELRLLRKLNGCFVLSGH